MADIDPVTLAANFSALEYAILEQALRDYWGMDLRAKGKMARSTFEALKAEAGDWLDENYPGLRRALDTYGDSRTVAINRATRMQMAHARSVA